jgi:hypothetical protein
MFRSPSVTLYVFATYLSLFGGALMFKPQRVMVMVGMQPNPFVWPRIVGALMIVLAFYYAMAAFSRLYKFMRWSVYARTMVAMFFTMFVMMEWCSPLIMVAAAVDLAAAGWTFYAMNQDKTW